jgi:DNA-directed RNA polymerase specialized sigma24 family protein
MLANADTLISRIRRIVGRLKVVPAAVQEDLAQDTAVQILQAIHDGRLVEDRIPNAYIRIIAERLSISRWRKEKRLRSFKDGEGCGLEEEPGRSGRDLDDLLEQAPHVLTARQLAILRLKLEDPDRTLADIADLLGRAKGSVGREWAAAQHTLRIALAD